MPDTITITIQDYEDVDWVLQPRRDHPIYVARFHCLQLIVEECTGDPAFEEPPLYWTWLVQCAPHSDFFASRIGGEDGLDSEEKGMATPTSLEDAKQMAYGAARDFLKCAFSEFNTWS